VAVTLGDAAGIGPEVALKALAKDELRGHAVVVGCPRIISEHAGRIGVPPPPIIAEVPWPCGPLPVPGRGSAETGAHTLACLREAVSMATAGEVDALVTGPASKEMLGRAGVEHAGQTELLAELTDTRRFLMMLVAGDLRVAVVTTHLPLARVAACITTQKVLDKLFVLHEGLRVLFGISDPRVAVLSLNPHGGDGGRCGNEEEKYIAPAVRAAVAQGLIVEGPLAADGVFATWKQKCWAAILAMYHDQGLAPFKALAFGAGVNVTLGLPVIRTSPDHGTAFELAGRCLASERSMIEAIKLALKMAGERHRRRGGSGPRDVAGPVKA
jgi:4-hydroxythreonine-4-phosphate dehydrogenase